MKTLIKPAAITAMSVALVWLILTVWVERTGPKRSWELGNPKSSHTVLIVYDPDPFYNLDEQISRSFGKALADHGFFVRIASVAALNQSPQPTDSYVFCANTYNWRPDWAVRDFIRKQDILSGRPVVAITIGSGSTETSQKSLEKVVLEKKGVLLDSRSFWLSRPNDEARIDESNSKVAVSMAYQWGGKVAERMKRQQSTQWVNMIRTSLQDVVPYFESNRMAINYYEKLYALHIAGKNGNHLIN
ncbi:hypothetical protein GCM10028805_26060 [Spirosoma harenae]